MAIAKATCTCGACSELFEVRVNRRNRKEADSFEAWAVENITECNDCKWKRIQAARTAENQAAADAAKEMGLPELTGSQKQIAWAESIRQRGILALKNLREYEKGPNEITAKYFDWIEAQRTASFWIENRDRFKYPENKQYTLQALGGELFIKWKEGA